MNNIFRVENIFLIKERVVLMGVVLTDSISVEEKFSFRTKDGSIKESIVLGIEKFRESNLSEVFKGDNVGLIVKGDKPDFETGLVLFDCNVVELKKYYDDGGVEPLPDEEDIKPLVKMNDDLRSFIIGNIEPIRRGYKITIDDFKYSKKLGMKYRSIMTTKIQKGLNIGFSSSVKIKNSIESLELVLQDLKTGDLELLPYDEFDHQLKKFHLDMSEDEVIILLKKLKDKVDLGIITQDEFESRRTELLPYIKN